MEVKKYNTFVVINKLIPKAKAKPLLNPQTQL